VYFISVTFNNNWRGYLRVSISYLLPHSHLLLQVVQFRFAILDLMSLIVLNIFSVFNFLGFEQVSYFGIFFHCHCRRLSVLSNVSAIKLFL